MGLALGLASSPALAAPPAAEPPPRVLLVLLDAVPFGLVDRLTGPEAGEAAIFGDFPPPVPLISTFPSSTSVAVPGMLAAAGLERSPGYEARFFDWEAGRRRGGGAISYFQIEFPWRDYFDWSGKGVWRSAFAALRPVEATIGRLDRALEAFVRSEAPRYTVYIETTDTAAHLRSPASLEAAFRSLDQTIARLRAAHPERPFRVVLFSDHGIAGGAPLINTSKPVRRALRAAGFRLGRRLEGPRDLVLTPYGLVSSFEAYTAPARREAAAATLAAVDGVDLCVVPDGEGWVVEGSAGSASIERRRGPEGDLWRYLPRTGDPLGYAEVARRLEAERGAGRDGDGVAVAGRAGRGDGWHLDRRWLEATARHRYPDALYRLAHAFVLVDNPASVVCSLEPGHMYGPGRTATLARLTQGALEWTHGALDRESSWGFLLTDLPGAVDGRPLRFDEGIPRILKALSAAPRTAERAAAEGPSLPAGGESQ